MSGGPLLDSMLVAVLAGLLSGVVIAYLIRVNRR